jgi:hypothetical protein
VCDPCYNATLRRRGTCAGCAAQRRLVWPPGAGATTCCDCAGITPMHACATCGLEDKLYERGSCERCSLGRRAREVMAGPDGEVPTALLPVFDAIVASVCARKALNWLRSGAGSPVLRALATGELACSHEALDAYLRPKAADYVRHMLVAHGALPERDEPLARFERWVDERVAAVERDEDRHLAQSFARWSTLRGVRHRIERTSGPRRTTTRAARNQITAAIGFLDWLAAEGLTASSCGQGDIDRWVTTGPASRRDVRHFLTWLAERKLVAKFTVQSPPQHAGEPMDPEHRWLVVRRLLHDDTVALEDRVAGSLVLLYAQTLSRIATMTTDQISGRKGVVLLRLGRYELTVPEPLASLLDSLVTEGRGHHVGIGATSTTPWLFPGLLPGQPITPSRLGDRLGRYGVDARAARRAALLQLAAEIPAAILADMLGITVNTAVGWVHAAGGDWANYAAIVSGRQILKGT